MFTTIDKALAALLPPLVAFIGLLTGIDLGLSPELLAAIAAGLSGILTWLVPNKQKAPPT